MKGRAAMAEEKKKSIPLTLLIPSEIKEKSACCSDDTCTDACCATTDSVDKSCCSDGSCTHEQSKKSIPIQLINPSKLQKKDSCTDSCCAPKQSVPIMLINPTPAKKDSCCQGDACCGEVPDEKTEGTTPLTGKINEYRVGGMDCPACARTIEKSLGKVKGINQVNVNYSTGKMQIAFVDDSVLESIPSHMNKIGFSVEPVVQTGNMQTFNIEGMDCGACAMTIERHMKSLRNVKEVNVSFSTGKMQITHEMSVEDVVKEVSKAGYKAFLVSNRRTNTETVEPKKGAPLTTISGILLALGIVGPFVSIPSIITTLLLAAVIVITGYKPAKSAFYAIKSKSLDMNVLMSAAAIGAALIGQWSEGPWCYGFFL